MRSPTLLSVDAILGPELYTAVVSIVVLLATRLIDRYLPGGNGNKKGGGSGGNP